MSIDENINKVTNLVIGGGGIAGLTFYGALKQLHKENIWKHEDIKHIYATSVGTILAIMISLKYDWKDLDIYIEKRPWFKIFKWNFSLFVNAIDKRGICDIEIIKEVINPLLLGMDLNTSINMKEFYDFTNIECNFMTTELNTMSIIQISHKTHPEWLLVDAIYSSCALPICFSPHIHNEKIYCDGGFLANLPIKQCIQDGCLMEETLVIGLVRKVEHNIKEKHTSQFNLFDFLFILLYNLINLANNHLINNSIYKEILFNGSNPDFNKAYEFINDEDFRKQLIIYGTDYEINKV